MRACWLHGQQSMLASASLLTAIRLLASVLFRCRRCSFARCSTFAPLARIRCFSMRAAVDRIAMLSTSRRYRRRHPSPPSLPSHAVIRRPCECGGFARAGRGCQLPRCTESHAAASRRGKGTQRRRAAADPTGSRPLAARPGRTHTAVRPTPHRRRRCSVSRGSSAGVELRRAIACRR